MKRPQLNSWLNPILLKSKSVPFWIIYIMFGSPNIQNRASRMSPLQTNVSSLPFAGTDSIHLTLKKQRIADNAEAPKLVHNIAEEEFVDFSAGSQAYERESLQMTPK